MLKLFGDAHASTKGTSESTHERCNHFKRERRAKQREQPSLRNDALQLFGDGDASVEGTLESAHERRNRLQRERRAKQREQPSLRNDALQLFGDGDASVEGTLESAHERRNRLQRERRAKQREQPSLRNDALQLFGDGDASASGRWDCGKMDIICGFCNAKMWIKERSANSTNNNPQFFFVLREWQSSVAESSCNTARVGSSFNQQKE
ncbi:unnamed protein product [Sphagnum troendelagicum]|uniref:Uncharacterized protein n=1 Tax=Sphagnum troendelagicum TaxID=128251 RepID=A0ABP0U2V4_9BRYO